MSVVRNDLDVQWNGGIGAFEHSVQFYEKDEFLYPLVADFIAGGLAAGEPAIVIATEPHREGIAAALRGRGLDLAVIPVTFLDARETLALFMDGEMPDEQRFQSVIGGAIEKGVEGADTRRIRAYGEMVDVLWRDGNPEAAIRLEELWNNLGRRYPFSLLCAYPIGNFYKESDRRLFGDVCATHSAVVPAESYTLGADDDTRLREISVLQARAAALQNEIEHRKELERALRESLRATQEANRTKDEFLATLSHELRTPLTAILGWARMLALGGLDPETMRTAFDTIERSARAQATLIDDLLDLSRVVTGKLTLQTELVDLATIIDNAVQTLRLAADAKQISIDVTLPADRSVVTGDSTRLGQITWNLLSNAIKFSNAGSRVSLELERDGDHARLFVRDDGRGISPDFLPHVFEAFRQADGASTRAHGGLGLGLAIVKYLTELHGGWVSASSRGEGKGATFMVALPLAMRSAVAVRTTKRDEIVDLRGTSVLLVDDDAPTRDLVLAMLRRCGAEVTAVESVQSACALLHVTQPHVVVTDIAMPGQDGFALLDFMRSGPDVIRRIPIVALTASANPESDQRADGDGFHAWVRKPIDPFQFASVIAGIER